MRSPAHFKLSIPLVANHYAVLLDATRPLGSFGANGTTAPTVGDMRAHPAYVGMRAVGFCRFNQAVTVLFKRLVNGAWAADAEAPDAGSKTLAADTDYAFSYLPQGTEYAIWVLAGATPPTTGTATVDLVSARTAGV